MRLIAKCDKFRFMKSLSWRTVILVWLMLLLPLQGFAAVSMWHCVQNKNLQYSVKLQTAKADTHCEQMQPSEQPEYAASDTASPSDHQLLKQAQADHCHGKSLCCVAVLMSAASLNSPGLTVIRMAAATPLPAYHSAELSLPERPPRLLS